MLPRAAEYLPDPTLRSMPPRSEQSEEHVLVRPSGFAVHCPHVAHDGAPMVSLIDAFSLVVTEPLGIEAGMLTPEFILALAERRLLQLDSEIVALAEELYQGHENAKLLNERQRVLRAIRSQVGLGSPEHILLNPPEGDPVNWVTFDDKPYRVADLLDEHGIHVPGDGTRVSGEALDQVIEQLGHELAASNTGADMLTLRLQQLVHSRAEAISMSSDLLKSLHDTNMTMIQNMR